MNKTDKKLAVWLVIGICSILYTAASLWYLFLKYIVGFQHSTMATIGLIVAIIVCQMYKIINKS